MRRPPQMNGICGRRWLVSNACRAPSVPTSGSVEDQEQFFRLPDSEDLEFIREMIR